MTPVTTVLASQAADVPLNKAAKASAPRLAAWPLVNLTYSSPISQLKATGQPLPSVATATTYPVTPGSTSEARKVAVCVAVKQTKLSAIEQPSETKNRCTAMPDEVEVLVILMRAFCVVPLVAPEV